VPDFTAAVIPPASQMVKNNSTAYQFTDSFSIDFSYGSIKIMNYVNEKNPL
jgi:hypothetical protein